MKQTAFQRARPAAAGFTLVEVLVASTVFILMIVLFSQVMVSMSRTAVSDNARMDGLSDTRQALDIFAVDWNARVRRPDVGMTVTVDPVTQVINTITFLTRARTYSGTRPLAAVCYEMNFTANIGPPASPPATPSPGNFKLLRGILGYNWQVSATNPQLTFPTPAAPTPTPFPVPSATPTPGATPAAPATATDFEPVSDHVFHLAISFLISNSTTGGFSMDPTLVNSSQVQGVVVSLAALDPASRQLITTSQLASLITALDQGILNRPGGVGDPASPAVSPLTIWQKNLNTAGFAATAAIPPRVAAAVQIYQRVFYLQE